MKRIVGLDIGVSSIGWSYLLESEIETDEETEDVFALGSRIIPLSQKDTDEFSKGDSITKHKARTQKRTARKTNNRYKLRKHKLSEVLNNQEIIINPELFDLTAHELYALRVRAIHEPVTLSELARLWYQFNQKRGYQSLRGVVDEEADKKSDYLSSINDRSQFLKDNKQTVGQFLFNRLQDYEQNRGVIEPITHIIFNRQDYFNEFNQIWERQKTEYPEVLTDELLANIRDRIIFYQRPLMSQKHLVSDCTFEKNHKAAPKSSPLFQVFKIWQDLNHFEIKTKRGAIVKFTVEMKQKVFEVLDNQFDINKTKLWEILGLKASEHRLNFKEIRGNVTKAKLVEAFAELNINRPDLLSFDPHGNPDEQPLFRIWHLLYSINEKNADEILLKTLQNAPYSFTETEAIGLIQKVSFKNDFGSLSSRAMRKILPYMEQGLNYADACLEVGNRHSNYRTKEENDERILADKLLPLLKNSLRQPVVEKIVNQVINVMNAILADPNLGRPDEIRIELARELKQNIKQRERTESNNNKRQKARKDVVKEILKKFPDMKEKEVTVRMILKFELFDETNGICIYTGKSMSLGAVLSGQGYDIEHIIPKSRRFDDSYMNKTIADKHTNKRKNDKTAYDYIRGGDIENPDLVSFEKFTEIIHNLNKEKKPNNTKEPKLPNTKLDNLLTTLNPVWIAEKEAKELSTDFISRQLNETQYITKQVKAELDKICKKVTVTSGGITDYLRHQWGVDDVLKNINLEKYEAAGKVSDEEYRDRQGQWRTRKKIEDWSKRDDHRHHAIDALVIACTKPAYIKRLNDLNQEYDSYSAMKKDGERNKSLTKFPQPKMKGGFIQNVTKATENILISFKAGKKAVSTSKNKKTGQVNIIPRGQLHEETVYGQKFDENGKPYYTIRKKLEFNKQGYFNSLAQIDKIEDKNIRAKVLKRIDEYGGDLQKALSSVIYHNEELKIPIKKVMIQAQIKKAVPLGNHEGRFVAEGNNHHLALYRNEKGKYLTELVSLWTAVVRKQNGLDIICRNHPEGHKFITCFQQNEMFIYELSPEQIQEAIDRNDKKFLSKYLYRMQKISKKNSGGIEVGFRHHLETKLDDSDIAEKIGKYILVEGMTKLLQFTKVKINHLGQITKIFAEGE
ncbi:MAG: type II CRISPR RNA-guided endonuclease Cas9 [Arcicella sp.]|nr:type II CRISPR RNA-guided endonuclease Cas9 [Arcicella sp.]